MTKPIMHAHWQLGVTQVIGQQLQEAEGNPFCVSGNKREVASPAAGPGFEPPRLAPPVSPTNPFIAFTLQTCCSCMGGISSMIVGLHQSSQSKHGMHGHRCR